MNQTSGLIGYPRLCELTQLHINSVYLKNDPKSKYYCPDFPKPVKISARRVGFVEAEVLAWIQARMDERAINKGSNRATIGTKS